MKSFIKKLLAKLGFCHPALGVKVRPQRKAELLLENQGTRRIFVESGTETGDMIERMCPHFKELYSIELNQEWHENARKRFGGASNVTLVQGDSAHKMPEVLQEISEPALFWLDAHESGAIAVEGPGAAPVLAELAAIAAHPVAGHRILIDDARHFDRRSIGKLKEWARIHGYRFGMREGLLLLT